MSFRCVVVTPEEQLADLTVRQAVIPAHDGLMGILTDRAPILVKLGLGALTLDLDAGRQVYFIDGGVAQMKDNVLTIATTEATPAAKLTAQEAEAELARATAERANASIPIEVRERSVRRARAKLAMTRG